MSDAVLSLGTAKALLRETVRCAFADIDQFRLAAKQGAALPSPGSAPAVHPCVADERATAPSEPDGDQFVLISHSLGAFVLLDTFLAAAYDANEPGAAVEPACAPLVKTAPGGGLTAAVKAQQSAEPGFASERLRASRSLCLVLYKSHSLYFMANQFSLLEMARAGGIVTTDFAKPPAAANAPADPGCPATNDRLNAMAEWAKFGGSPEDPKTIVAFSDPGDLLTFKLPQTRCAPELKVVNVYLHNAFYWLGLFEDPVQAHMGYLTKPGVLRAVFGE